MDIGTAKPSREVLARHPHRLVDIRDPARGGELAKAQFARGVDVVFAAAGGTGVGVYQAAKDAGKLAMKGREPVITSYSIHYTKLYEHGHP